ncbi:hypothetical protein LZ30DRAFT_796577 [Colletotrichum cereale]|nr:hypothetical protein LZ30DRAFT_796577 [Colletotrichum cereale]
MMRLHSLTHTTNSWIPFPPYVQHVHLFTASRHCTTALTAALLKFYIRLLEQLIRNDPALSFFVLEQSSTAPLAPLTSSIASTAHPRLHAHSVPVCSSAGHLPFLAAPALDRRHRLTTAG